MSGGPLLDIRLVRRYLWARFFGFNSKRSSCLRCYNFKINIHTRFIPFSGGTISPGKTVARVEVPGGAAERKAKHHLSDLFQNIRLQLRARDPLQKSYQGEALQGTFAITFLLYLCIFCDDR